MCGRFVLAGPGKALDRLFALAPVPEALPRYNVAPSQNVLAVRRVLDGAATAWTPRWGLVPAWAKDAAGGAKMINARSETAATKPAFREPLRRRRCVIPAEGFYEWTARGRRPWLFRVDDGGPFGFAGLWERWTAPDGTTLDTAAILTTAANPLVAPVHDRMPLILPQESLATWLDPELQDVDALAPLCVPFPAARMSAVPVGPYVNSVAHEGPRCIEPEASLFDPA